MLFATGFYEEVYAEELFCRMSRMLDGEVMGLLLQIISIVRARAVRLDYVLAWCTTGPVISEALASTFPMIVLNPYTRCVQPDVDKIWAERPTLGRAMQEGDDIHVR
ncbi:hypothetical protein ACFX2B_031298 [Malus domestica]